MCDFALRCVIGGRAGCGGRADLVFHGVSCQLFVFIQLHVQKTWLADPESFRTALHHVVIQHFDVAAFYVSTRHRSRSLLAAVVVLCDCLFSSGVTYRRRRLRS